MKEEIIANNKLIAEFMGGSVEIIKDYVMNGSYPVPGLFKDVEYISFNGSLVRVSFLSYHDSYNSIIPVMQKIYMTATSKPKEYYDVTHIYAVSTVDQMYLKVLAFIKWYNEHQN